MKYQDPNKLPELTKKQEEIFALMLNNPGCILHMHKRPTGTECYRMRSAQHSPIINVTLGLVNELVSKKRIVRNVEGHYIVNPAL